jgi:uncharacterized protein YhhL (DUF1145 family)
MRVLARCVPSVFSFRRVVLPYLKDMGYFLELLERLLIFTHAARFVLRQSLPHP